MLKVENVTLSFGGLKAINNVSIEVLPNRVSALIGPNGAGKTTLFNIISGVYHPDKGSITFNDKKIDRLKPFQINEEGISRTYQVINLFRNMSVLDNVMVGMHTQLKAGIWRAISRTSAQKLEERKARERADELLDFVGLTAVAKDKAGSLSYGNQRLLEIIRSLASTPKLILLDEPAAGMNSQEKDDLNALIRKIILQNVTVLIVEHDMNLIMDIADHIFVLNSGAKLAEGTPSEIQNNPVVIEAYLGGDD